MASTSDDDRRYQRDLTRIQVWASVFIAFGAMLFGIFGSMLITGQSAVAQSMILEGQAKIFLEQFGNNLKISSLIWLIVGSIALGIAIWFAYYKTERAYQQYSHN